MILQLLRDVEFLCSIVHASPTIHSLYCSARKEMLTSVTVRQLTDRGFNPFGPQNVVDVYMAGGQR